MSSVRYVGSTPWSALKLYSKILKTIRERRGSQCSSISSGVTYQELKVVYLKCKVETKFEVWDPRSFFNATYVVRVRPEKFRSERDKMIRAHLII